MKYTPGPWTICYDGQLDGPKGKRICTFDWDSYKSFNESNNAANARLIAAAPELLDRLTLIENLATQVCDAINKRDAIAYEETLISIKMLAREAIVEATDKGYHSFNQRGNSV